MTRYAKRVDANHSQLRDELRAAGWDVMDLSGAGDGIPDLCVQVIPGRPHFLEIKDGAKVPSKQKLTSAQERWNTYCGAVTSKVRNVAEAIEALQSARALFNIDVLVTK